MEPIDQRITAARLLALRGDPDAEQAIAIVLGVAHMPGRFAMRTRKEIQRFVGNGDATLASQLIHAALVRRAHA